MTDRPGPSVRTKIIAVSAGTEARREDAVATEEPLEIRAIHRGADHGLGVTMRTPGHDFELAVGWMFGEGLIRGREDVARVSYCASGPPEQHYNIVSVDISERAPFVAPQPRARPITSACGVCGTATIDEVLERAAPSVRAAASVRAGASDGASDGAGRSGAGRSGAAVVDAATLSDLPRRLRASQRLFERTGGAHAAGLFTAAGDKIVVREDVGRHNAVDKVIGERLLAGALPLGEVVLQVSGRASFEIIAKAVRAGIPVVSSVGAPSSLAVSLAERAGLTLACFVGEGGFNLYAGADGVSRDP